MKPVQPRNLRIATRGTTREINRRVVLNLIRKLQCYRLRTLLIAAIEAKRGLSRSR